MNRVHIIKARRRDHAKLYGSAIMLIPDGVDETPLGCSSTLDALRLAYGGRNQRAALARPAVLMLRDYWRARVIAGSPSPLEAATLLRSSSKDTPILVSYMSENRFE